MKHAVKMVLVPHESVARLQEKPVTPTPQTQMNALDSDMSLILKKQYASDSEKWKEYNATLQRYLHFAGEGRKPLTFELGSNKLDEEEPPKKEDTHSAIREQLIEVMPKTYKVLGSKVFDYLSRDGSTVTWDSVGTVSVHGTPVPHSNIIDLISDLTRSRKNFVPHGVDKFIEAVARMNIPLELVKNERRRTAILRYKQGGSHQSGRGRQKAQVATEKPAKKHAWKAW